MRRMSSNLHSIAWFMIGKVQELSGRGVEQEVPEGEPAPEEEDTSNDISSSVIAIVSYLGPVCSVV